MTRRVKYTFSAHGEEWWFSKANHTLLRHPPRRFAIFMDRARELTRCMFLFAVPLPRFFVNCRWGWIVGWADEKPGVGSEAMEGVIMA